MLTLSKNRILIIGIAAVILIGAVLTAVLLPPKMQERKVRRYIDLGMQYLNDLDYEAAILYFQEAIALNPNNEQAKNALIRTYKEYGALCMQNGEYLHATEVYEMLVALVPTEENYFLLAQAYAALGENDGVDRTIMKMTEQFGTSRDDLIAKLYVSETIQKATCGTDGVTKLTAIIGGTERTGSIPATGNHTWDEGSALEETFADGEITMRYTCPDCGGIKEERTAAEVIMFDDVALEAVVREIMGKPTGDIYTYEAEKITEICADSADIQSIEVLKHFKNLTILWLDNNQIRDINVLKGLTNLSEVWLSNNPIDYISIREMDCLPNLRMLVVDQNQISDYSMLTGLKRLPDIIEFCIEAVPIE